MHSFDLLVQNYFELNHSTWLTQAMYLVTGLFDPSILIILVFLFSGLFIYLIKGKNEATLFLFALVLGWLSVYILKQFFDINRPVGGVITALGQSFPSGHATIATAYFVMIMRVFRHHFRGFWGAVLNSFCIAAIFLIAFSRVYLGVHWVSDVLAGIVLGVSISYISTKIFKKVSS